MMIQGQNSMKTSIRFDNEQELNRSNDIQYKDKIQGSDPYNQAKGIIKFPLKENDDSK